MERLFGSQILQSAIEEYIVYNETELLQCNGLQGSKSMERILHQEICLQLSQQEEISGSIASENEIIRSELAEYSEQQEAARKREEEKQEIHRRKMEARKQHHLVSTEVMPGIYNSPFLPYPTEKEYLLRNVRPLSHKKAKKEEADYDPAWAKYNSKVPKVLPPLVQRPQGPFREPADVQKQRYKPFQPTLRVATDFYSLDIARSKLKDEEWVTRFNDAIFKPFTHRSVQYEPLLHTTSRYGHLPYGTKYFREEFLDKHVFSQNFKTLVPPIPIFDKLNDTYSQGQV